MATLLMRLAGPMQSWGTTSRFDERDTQLEPSKSGVLGVICAALGRDRAEPVDDLARLRMGVRIDREGVLMRDFQTVMNVVTAGSYPGKEALREHPVVSPRYYLADAAFLVGFEGDDLHLLDTIQKALKRPVWPLALGRKSFPPGQPVWLAAGLQADDLETALRNAPSIAPPQREHRERPLRLLLEDPSEGAVRLDQPVAPFATRRFGPRFVRSGVVDAPRQAHP